MTDLPPRADLETERQRFNGDLVFRIRDRRASGVAGGARAVGAEMDRLQRIAAMEFAVGAPNSGSEAA